MIKLLVQIALFYLLYKFIQYFIMPVIKTAKDLSGKSEAMRQASKKQEKADTTGPNQSSGTKRPPYGEYIDFEEIK
jgi:hypothetical protein